MHITKNTSRADLLNAIYGESELVDAFIKANLDPEHMTTEAVYEFVVAWIQAGDETA